MGAENFFSTCAPDSNQIPRNFLLLMPLRNKWSLEQQEELQEETPRPDLQNLMPLAFPHKNWRFEGDEISCSLKKWIPTARFLICFT